MAPPGLRLTEMSAPMHPSLSGLRKVPPALLAPLLLAVTLLSAAGLGIAHAQGDPESLERALAIAVIQDFASREGVPDSAIDVLRLDAVTWGDACLGAAAEGEVCAQALTDGWVIWLGGDVSDTAARYHTNLDGSVFRLAAVGLALDRVRVGPLPPGATPRADRLTPKPETPVLVLEPSVGTVAEFLAALEAAGLPSALQGIGILRPEIGVPSVGQVQLDGATIEVYDLGSVAAAEDLVNSLRGETVVLAGNVTYWVGGQIAVVLTNAPANPDVQQIITSIVGSPVLLTITGPTPILPDTGDDTATDGLVPETFPATGSGGLAEDDDSPAIALWAGVGAALLTALVLTLGLWRRRLG